MSTPEREHPRYAHEAAVTLHVGNKAYDGHTRNVSRGGLCADLPAAIALGTDLAVDLSLVFDEDTQSDPLRLAARVVWCTKVDDGYQIGLVFKPLSAEQLEFMNLFLRFLDDHRDEQLPREQSLDDRFR